MVDSYVVCTRMVAHGAGLSELLVLYVTSGKYTRCLDALLLVELYCRTHLHPSPPPPPPPSLLRLLSTAGYCNERKSSTSHWHTSGG